MRQNFIEDTIAAVSTPVGEGGIGIVRMSGPSAVKIADRIFISRGRKKLSKFKSHTIHYGYITKSEKRKAKSAKHDKEIIDEVLLTVMKAPKTYTKEDVVEINCHGGIVAVQKILEALVKNGARPASPGEFTKRAFLNGRIDLAQAEAVLDVIRSKTDAGLRASLNQLEGDLSREIKIIRGSIIETCAGIEGLIDFPEEDIGADTAGGWLRDIKSYKSNLEKLLSTYHDGAILKEGIVAVICGRPNVGKSSLLNLLLKKHKAIVTHIPGTTRDPVEETANVRGIPIRFVDTAGIRKERDIVEKEGIKRSHLYLSRADLVICVLDGSKKLKKEDRGILSKVKDKSAIVVINKCDLKPKVRAEEVRKIMKNGDVLRVSCIDKIGIDKLEERIYNKVWSGKVHSSNEVMVNNIRHKDAIESAIEALSKAEEGITHNILPEFTASDIKRCANSLGEITGEVYTDDILNVIFSRFCIGK